VIASVDACTIVTAADVLSATGTTVATSSAGAAQVPGLCFYSSADNATNVIVFAQTYPDTSTADAVSPEQMASAMNGYGIANAKAVTGIGDKAVEYTGSAASGASGIVIFVFKSNVVLMIALSPSTSSTAIELLAKAAVGKL
jgi:hypothetical protein